MTSAVFVPQITDEGINIKDYITNLLTSIDEAITNCRFELTTDDGKHIKFGSPNKISFNVKRK